MQVGVMEMCLMNKYANYLRMSELHDLRNSQRTQTRIYIPYIYRYII
jgi:hypothetical protein